MSDEKKKPTAKEQQPQTYLQVESGIYRYKDKQGELTYHERPSIPGYKHRSYRALGYGFAKLTNLGNARTEYHRRRTELAAGRNPYAEIEPAPPATKPTVSEVIQKYVDAGYPDRYLKPRAGRTLDSEADNCETLLEYWDGQVWDTLTAKSWDDYHAWRTANVKEGCSGDRSVDAERVTLSNAFHYGMRKELVTGNPAENFHRHQPQSAVRHCREFQPQDADELHAIASILFEDLRGMSLGFQLLYEAYTGLRTEEVLMLRNDAKPGEPGYVAPDGNMHVRRVKHGCNPYVRVNAGLRELLKAHALWKTAHHPKSPWFLPGRVPGQAVNKNALQHALRSLRKRIGRKVTSHGMRAFYVLVRRSQGADDNQIAWELGQRSGGALIASTYGDIPDSWKTGAPQMPWLPKGKPAWESIKPPKTPRRPAQSTAAPAECPPPALAA